MNHRLTHNSNELKEIYVSGWSKYFCKNCGAPLKFYQLSQIACIMWIVDILILTQNVKKINVIGIVDGADEEVECTLNINILIYSRLLWEESFSSRMVRKSRCLHRRSCFSSWCSCWAPDQYSDVTQIPSVSSFLWSLPLRLFWLGQLCLSGREREREKSMPFK